MSTTTLSPAEQQILAQIEREQGGPVVPPVAAVPPAAPTAPAPAQLENDPTGVTPALPAPPPAPAELPEKRYEYFLKDDNGKPMGGKQVIVYRTEEEFREKLIKNQENAVRQLRKVTREKELGPEQPEVDDAEKFQNVVEFKPRALSADERFNLSQKLQNPETAGEAVDLFIESAFGQKPSVLAHQLNEQQRFMIQQKAVDNYVEFVSSGDGYYDSPSNRVTITSWMGRQNWAPTVANFNKAYQRLSQAGLLELAPEVHQEIVPPAPAPVVAPVVVPVEQAPKPQESVAANPGLGSEPQPQAKRHSHVPSGLTPSVASTAGDSPVDGKNVTLADIDKLPADVYKAKMKDPAFRKLVDTLEEDAAKKRRAKQLGQ